MPLESTTAAPNADTSRVPLDTDKMRRLREKLGLTMEQAAQRAGLGNRQRWNEIESGRSANVKLTTLEAVAQALGVQARDLLIDQK